MGPPKILRVHELQLRHDQLDGCNGELLLMIRRRDSASFRDRFQEAEMITMSGPCPIEVGTRTNEASARILVHGGSLT